MANGDVLYVVLSYGNVLHAVDLVEHLHLKLRSITLDYDQSRSFAINYAKLRSIAIIFAKLR